MYNPYFIFFVLPLRIFKDLGINVAYPVNFAWLILSATISIDIILLYKEVYINYFGANIIVSNIMLCLSVANLILSFFYLIYKNRGERIIEKYMKVKVNLTYNLFFYLFYILSFMLFVQL